MLCRPLAKRRLHSLSPRGKSVKSFFSESRHNSVTVRKVWHLGEILACCWEKIDINNIVDTHRDGNYINLLTWRVIWLRKQTYNNKKIKKKISEIFPLRWQETWCSIRYIQIYTGSRRRCRMANTEKPNVRNKKRSLTGRIQFWMFLVHSENDWRTMQSRTISSRRDAEKRFHSI